MKLSLCLQLWIVYLWEVTQDILKFKLIFQTERALSKVDSFLPYYKNEMSYLFRGKLNENSQIFWKNEV